MKNTLLIAMAIWLFFGFACKKETSKQDLSWLKQDLLAHYPLNGNAKDSSGNGYDGVVNGAVPSTDKNGKSNSAFTFPNNTYISLNLNESHFLGDYSISFWSQSPITNITDPVVFCSLYFGINYAGNLLKFTTTFDNPVSFIENRINIDASNWNHVTVLCKNDTTKMYLNGTYISYTTLNGQRSKLRKGNFITIGRDCYGNNPQYYNFTGKVDEIRFYKRALTDEQIKYLSDN